MSFKKLLLCLSTFLLNLTLYAQTYYQVTVTNGSQVVNGITVTVTPINSPTTLNYCGAGPYWIGSGTSVGAAYKYVFSSPISAIRMHLTAMDAGEEITSQINGTTYTYTSANISAFPGTCVCPNVITAISGYLINNTTSTFDGGATIDIGAVSVDSFVMTHAGQNQNGTIYDFYFTNDCPGTITASTPNDTICTGNSINLSYTSSSMSSSATYSWSGPNSFSSSLPNPAISNASTLASGTYTITATDTGSCVYTSSVSITVNTAPSFSASSNSPLCPGDTLNLTSTGLSGFTYQWAGPGSFAATTQNPSVTAFVITDTGNYTITASNSTCSVSATTHVIANNPGTPVVSYNNPVCAGDTLKLMANSASPGVTYSWTGPNSFSSATQNPDIANAQANNSGTYTATAFLNGCSISSSASVTINPILGPPIVNINASPGDTICGGADITLTATAGNAGTPSYQWKKNGVNIAGATNASLTTGAVNNLDVISCKVTSNAPCQPVDTATSNPIQVHVIVLPPPAVTITTYPLNYTSGSNVTFTGHIPGSSTGLTYQWIKNGVYIPGATTSVYSTSNLKAGDSICLLVHSSVPCTFPDSTLACVKLTTGATITIPTSDYISLYPNPNNGNFTLNGQLNDDKEISYNIINTLGQVVYSGTSQIDNGALNTQVNLGKLPNGTYMLIINADNNNQTIKFSIYR